MQTWKRIIVHVKKSFYPIFLLTKLVFKINMSFMIGEIIIGTRKADTKGQVLINFVFKDFLKDIFAQAKIKKKAGRENFTGEKNEILTIEENSSHEEFFLVGAGKKTEFDLILFRNLLADALRLASRRKFTDVSLYYFPELGTDFFELGKNLSLAFYLSNYHYDKFKSSESKKKIKRIERLNLYLDKISEKDRSGLQDGIKQGKLIAQGVYLTRNLVNEPASHLYPSTLVEEAFKIEKESKGKIKVEILDKDECQRLGMGAFLGVAEGSDKEPKFIVLKYKSEKLSNSKKIALVGKSITFDSGGLSLKPSSGMEDMKIDMAGGATVLGIFKTLSQLSLNLEVFGILPACENMPSGKAIKPGDIVTALNGKTIEVLNTDAEGRLALADALCYAEKFLKADYIIDIATLTGACRVALGNDITAVIGNDKKFVHDFLKACGDSKEEVWEMPLYKQYSKHVKGEVTDLKNTGSGKGAGTITAALFLFEFISKSKWIHLDIAGTAFATEKPRGIIPKGATGWGVISILKFLTNYL